MRHQYESTLKQFFRRELFNAQWNKMEVVCEIFAHIYSAGQKYYNFFIFTGWTLEILNTPTQFAKRMNKSFVRDTIVWLSPMECFRIYKHSATSQRTPNGRLPVRMTPRRKFNASIGTPDLFGNRISNCMVNLFSHMKCAFLRSSFAAFCNPQCNYISYSLLHQMIYASFIIIESGEDTINDICLGDISTQETIDFAKKIQYERVCKGIVQIGCCNLFKWNERSLALVCDQFELQKGFWNTNWQSDLPSKVPKTQSEKQRISSWAFCFESIYSNLRIWFEQNVLAFYMEICHSIVAEREWQIKNLK